MKNSGKSNSADFLREELVRRLERNPRYSMRAFASLLRINVGTLSGLISGKRTLTMKGAVHLCGRLGISPNDRAKILQTLASKTSKASKLVLRGEVPKRVELEEETFRLISDWYHYAILQVVRTKGYLENPKAKGVEWISRQLNITKLEAKLAIDRLIKLNLLADSGGVLSRTEERVTTANKGATSAALKKLQRQVREKAIYSLEHDPVERRSMTSVTVAINPKKIEQAKLLIDEFQEKLCDLLEEGGKEKVYQLEIGLYPIQIMEN